MVHRKMESFKTVLQRQKPDVPGKPYVMEVFSNKLPKSAGDPWRGAYSKHGFWYKFHDGEKQDFDKLVALSFEQNGYMLNYDYITAWENAYGISNIRVLVARNLKKELMGGLVAINKGDYTQIGAYFVMEEYRHSGIGSMLFREALKGKVGVIQAVHHLLPTVSNFGMKECYARRFNHIKIDKASGFPDLQESLADCRVVLAESFKTSDWDAVSLFDREVSAETRPIRELLALEDSETAALFDDKGICLGFGTSREIAGEGVRRIIVGPLYARDQQTGEILMKAILKKYYNPDLDFDFDPDPFAIYRRIVEYLIPAEERVLPVIEKLAGKDGKLSRPRMWYQMILRLLAQLLLLPIVVHSIPVDNGVDGKPEVECGPTAIQVNANTQNPFMGHVYVKPRFVTKVDRAYRISCFYMEAAKDVSSPMNVSELTTANVERFTQMPICRYDILEGGPNGMPVQYATIGQQVYHQWICKSETIDTFCMLVHSCTVDDGKGDEVPILDSNGCALDRYVLNNIEYPDDLEAGQEAHVYKYADRDGLFYQCQITIHLKENEECPRPVCTDLSKQFAAVAPSRSNAPHQSQTVQFITAKDSYKRNLAKVSRLIRVQRSTSGNADKYTLDVRAELTALDIVQEKPFTSIRDVCISEQWILFTIVLFALIFLTMSISFTTLCCATSRSRSSQTSIMS
ncbi:unnamed protein product [Cylicocyclus nassatus]|uniref:ZP domain-containing protein n=1 Tax=Cylicocyclus nassatus TaxID=53992 RepID=A0AA36H5D1_CYLNA|nr:unnamed protein product [Cylicocyclus nassatus]